MQVPSCRLKPPDFAPFPTEFFYAGRKYRCLAKLVSGLDSSGHSNKVFGVGISEEASRSPGFCYVGDLKMKFAWITAALVCFAGLNSADAGLFHNRCCAPAPSCCAPAPTCAAPAAVAPSCCAPVAAAPAVCAPAAVAPTCCAPAAAPSCCAPVAPSCCGHKHNCCRPKKVRCCVDRVKKACCGFKLPKLCCHKKTCCAPAPSCCAPAAAPTCCAPAAAPTCAAPAAACCN